MASTIDQDSQAFARGSTAKNEAFVFTGKNVQSKILIAAPYNPAKTAVVDNTPVRIFNAADMGSKAGFGWPAHRMAIKVFKGNNNQGEVYWSPQADAGGAVVADAEIAWTGTTTAAGHVFLRISNELYKIPIVSGSTPEVTSDAVVAFVNAIANTPVVAAKTAVTFETTLTMKSKGAFGNDVLTTISADQTVSPAEALPAGLTAVIVQMVNGVGLPDIADTLTGMGLDGTDDVNEQSFTQLVHMNGLDTTTIDAINDYVGSANDKTGCWSALVGRPFLCLTGDTTVGTAGLTALKVITDARLSNQSCGILAAPDEDEHPQEIAAQAVGEIGQSHQFSPAKNYSETVLSGIGGRSVSANRWTNDYTSGRDEAVKSGISPTDVTNKQVLLQNVVTMYRPDSIPTASNGWSSYRSFFVELNILVNGKVLFSGPDYKGFYITADKSLVTNTQAAENARDLDDVRNDMNSFIDNYLVPNGLIYDGDFAKENSSVALRSGSNGFVVIFKYQESGEGQIITTEQIFDKNITI